MVRARDTKLRHAVSRVPRPSLGTRLSQAQPEWSGCICTFNTAAPYGCIAHAVRQLSCCRRIIRLDKVHCAHPTSYLYGKTCVLQWLTSSTEVRRGPLGMWIEKTLRKAKRSVVQNVQKAQEQDLKTYHARRERVSLWCAVCDPVVFLILLGFSHRVASCTSVQVIPAKYRKKWACLDIHYMSEEDGHNGTIVVKKFHGILKVGYVMECICSHSA